MSRQPGVTIAGTDQNGAEFSQFFASLTGGLPLPLGGNAIRRDMEPALQKRVSHLLRESIRYALDHREEAARRQVHSLQRSLDEMNDFTNGPVIAVGVQRPVDRKHRVGIANGAPAAEAEKRIVGADYLLPAEGEVSLRLLTKKDDEALGVMRHSCAHIMARAVMRPRV